MGCGWRCSGGGGLEGFAASVAMAAGGGGGVGGGGERVGSGANLGRGRCGHGGGWSERVCGRGRGGFGTRSGEHEEVAHSDSNLVPDLVAAQNSPTRSSLAVGCSDAAAFRLRGSSITGVDRWNSLRPEIWMRAC